MGISSQQKGAKNFEKLFAPFAIASSAKMTAANVNQRTVQKSTRGNMNSPLVYTSHHSIADVN
jgi:hypothetical protein